MWRKASSDIIGTEVSLSVPKMAEELTAGRINLAFLVSGAPSAAVQIMLDADDIRLLSINLRRVDMIAGSILNESEIDPNTYKAQFDGPTVTVSTRAVLVTTKDVDADIGAITAALFRAADNLKVGGQDALGTDLFALELHPDAMRYYKAHRALRGSGPRPRSSRSPARPWRLPLL